jgi:hypothetical protein
MHIHLARRVQKLKGDNSTQQPDSSNSAPFLTSIPQSDSHFLLAMSNVSTMYLGVHTHVMGESGLGLPANRSSGRANFFHHPVDLLESETLCLPYHEVGVAQLSAEFQDGLWERRDTYTAQPIQVPPQMKKTLDFRSA